MDYKELAPEYVSLFSQCETRTVKDSRHPVGLSDVESFVSHLLRGRSPYEDVEYTTGVPWFVVGLIHGLEGGFNFSTHLHNGDSLNRRTVNDPPGRPIRGTPPFSWKYSAEDSLDYDNLVDWKEWGVSGILYKLESYNGWGYRKYHHIRSPYLWSGSSLYDKGKYGSDGNYDPNLVSQQVGAAVALKHMTTNHIVDLKGVEV